MPLSRAGPCPLCSPSPGSRRSPRARAIPCRSPSCKTGDDDEDDAVVEVSRSRLHLRQPLRPRPRPRPRRPRRWCTSTSTHHHRRRGSVSRWAPWRRRCRPTVTCSRAGASRATRSARVSIHSDSATAVRCAGSTCGCSSTGPRARGTTRAGSATFAPATARDMRTSIRAMPNGFRRGEATLAVVLRGAAVLRRQPLRVQDFPVRPFVGAGVGFDVVKLQYQRHHDRSLLDASARIGFELHAGHRGADLQRGGAHGRGAATVECAPSRLGPARLQQPGPHRDGRRGDQHPESRDVGPNTTHVRRVTTTTKSPRPHPRAGRGRARAGHRRARACAGRGRARARAGRGRARARARARAVVVTPPTAVPVG